MTTSIPLACSIYRSSKRAELYLYVKQKQELSELPAEILKSLGELEHAMDLLLTPEKKLARANSAEVIESIETNSFYLQMPPSSPELQVDTLLAQNLTNK